MEWLMSVRWSPYVVGAGIGILSWLTWVVSASPLGCSTSFSRTAGMMEKAIRGKKVEQKPYYREVAPTVDWQWMLVLGMVIGALASSLFSGDFQFLWVPSRWVLAFGDNVGLRLLAALTGGVFLGFGARWADGCTSGHGISGTMQLAISSWVTAICFFISGVITAHVLYVLVG